MKLEDMNAEVKGIYVLKPEKFIGILLNFSIISKGIKYFTTWFIYSVYYEIIYKTYFPSGGSLWREIQILQKKLKR